MRPVNNHRPAAPRSRLVLTLIGALAVAATAIPMLPVWLPHKTALPVPSPAAGQTPAPRVVVVDLRDNASEADIRELETRHNLDLDVNSIHARDDKLMRATVGAGRDLERLIGELRGDPRVEAAEPEGMVALPEPRDPAPQGISFPDRAPLLRGRFVPNDPRYGEQWNLRMVGAETAWERTRGKGVVVAVIDTGVAAKDSPRGKQARDFGQTRFARGYDFVHNDDDPYDDQGHGTHVAGTVAESTNNKEGVAGLAFEATILPLKVLSAQGSGTTTDVADAIRYAADHGARVINMSLGSLYPSDVVHSAVKYARKKGVAIVCAAGNGFSEGVNYPAAFPECIAVSSVGPGGELAFYSSYGKQVALAAPGGDMRSGPQGGILQNTVFPEDQGGRGDDYYHFQGTSMASPHVAAVAALLVEQGVHDPARIRDLLTRSATHKEPEIKYGAGILSAGKATALAAGTQTKALFQWLLFAAVVGLILILGRDRSSALRLALAAGLGAGLFGPDLLADHVGADSAWNLAAGALIPFLLFWEMEGKRGSKIVASLALGVALSLTANLLTGALPFTVTSFGDRALPWTVANAGASLFIAGLAWRRGRS